jgi:hypothetical protein
MDFKVEVINRFQRREERCDLGLQLVIRGGTGCIADPPNYVRGKTHIIRRAPTNVMHWSQIHYLVVATRS